MSIAIDRSLDPLRRYCWAMGDRVVIVGGGIAGVSAAAFLADRGAEVTLVEREPTLAYHTTGRSAAQWIVNYGHPATRRLTASSRDFFDHPPPGTADSPLLCERPVVMVSDSPDTPVDDQFADPESAAPSMEPVPVAEAAELCPMVDITRTSIAFIDHGSMEIDVGALHQGFVRMLRGAGGTITTATRVDAARPKGDRWTVETTGGEIVADVLVNAAGAWGDVVAAAAGITPIGLQPRRRTAFMVPGSAMPGFDAARSHEWPMLIDLAHRWYVKPDGAQFL
ncbi:MAG: FAD-binding oxidoreductase, partial [Acidimicrobiales bacterium]|nr:FAD-binding oxidoreductase [Acidimicrobiales bacterium]